MRVRLYQPLGEHEISWHVSVSHNLMDHWVSFLCHIYCGARIRITFKSFRSRTGFVSFSIYFYHVNGRANGGAGELIVFLLSLGFYFLKVTGTGSGRPRVHSLSSAFSSFPQSSLSRSEISAGNVSGKIQGRYCGR